MESSLAAHESAQPFLRGREPRRPVQHIPERELLRRRKRDRLGACSLDFAPGLSDRDHSHVIADADSAQLSRLRKIRLAIVVQAHHERFTRLYGPFLFGWGLRHRNLLWKVQLYSKLLYDQV